MLNKLRKETSGISLIVLIITMVVMIILASAIILNLNNDGTSIVNKTNEVTFKSDIQTMIDNYTVIYDNLVYEYEGDLSLITDEQFQDKNIIIEKYNDRFKVTKDGIIYFGSDEKEKGYLTNMDVIIE